jgi:nitrogen regulatory protein P-II 1
MKRIEAIIRPLRLEPIKAALAEADVTGLTVTDVRGSGRSQGHRSGIYRGEEYIIRLPPKIKLEMVVRDQDVEDVIHLLLEQAQTGEEGDGKIFVLPVSETLRIRTGETGESIL